MLDFFRVKKSQSSSGALKNLHIETEAHMLTYVDSRPDLVWVG